MDQKKGRSAQYGLSVIISSSQREFSIKKQNKNDLLIQILILWYTELIIINILAVGWEETIILCQLKKKLNPKRCLYTMDSKSRPR